jgi:hypothetical protein
VDGAQLTLPGLILTNNVPVNAGFGTHGIGGDLANGLVLLENLNYIRSYNRGLQEGIPTLGTPVVTITNFDGEEPITTHTPFYNGSSVQELIATNTADHGTTDRNTEGVMVQELCLANGRGITGQVVRPSIDMVSYLEDSSRLSLEGRVPGVAIGIHADGVGALTPFVNLQPDPNSIPYPNNEWPVYGAPTPSFDNEGIYALATIPLTNGTGGTDYMDTATGLMTTTEGGQVEDRTTAVEHNQTAPEVTAPEADDAPLANPTPIDIPPPERVGGNPGRGRLTTPWLQRFLNLQTWLKQLRISDAWGIDEIKVMLNMLKPYLNELENLFGEDINGEEWSWLFGVWSEGQEIVKELEARGQDERSVARDDRYRWTNSQRCQ